MAKKKTTRNSVPSRKGTDVPLSSGKKKIVITEDEQEELKTEGELPKKSVRKRESRQLIWFFVIVGIIFASFLVPYFWLESVKFFEYGGADWAVEDYEDLRIYHGRFLAYKNPSLTFNVYLRGDPRKNDVRTEGTFDKFKGGGIISFSPEIAACRGELARVTLDLGSFMRQGIGVGSLNTGFTDSVAAVESGKRHAVCNKVNDRTLVILDIGESAVVQDEKNPYCYTIYAEDCSDISSVEKFIIKSIDDFSKGTE